MKESKTKNPSPSSSHFVDSIKFTYDNVKSKRIWLVIFIILLIYIVSGRALPILFGDAVDDGIIANDSPLFVKIASIFLVTSIVRSITGFALYYLVGVESNKIAYRVRKNLFGKVLSLPTKYFDQNSSGKILTRVANDTRSYQTFLGQGLIGIFINFFELLSILVALIYESFILSLVVMLVFPTSFFISKTITKKIENLYFEAKSILSNLNSYLADSLNGFSIIKGYGIYNYKYKNFKSQNDNYFEKQIEISKLFAILWPQIEFIQLLTIFLSFLLGAYMIPLGKLEAGQLISFTLLVQSIFHPLRFILERMNQIQNGVTSAQRIIHIHEQSSETKYDSSSDKDLPDSFKPSIEIKNLYFSYGESSKFIFEDFNLSIPANTSTALVGRTGSGKTTLMSLLQRLYEPTKGSIMIGEANINEVSRESLRENLCIVRQEDFIFEGTMLENITLTFKDDADRSRAQKALEFSQISKDLDYKISTSGENLSPGERQLISFARVFYHSPKILIFDEATSFIDENTEALIQEKCKELFKNRTVIVVAHKKATIDMCERIVSL